jgi:hypothetical protein
VYPGSNSAKSPELAGTECRFCLEFGWPLIPARELVELLVSYGGLAVRRFRVNAAQYENSSRARRLTLLIPDGYGGPLP